MKKVFLISMAIGILAVSACKKIDDKKVTVIKNCTGAYLRYQGKDYHVCNVEATDTFRDGQEVVATFKKIKNCSREMTVCMMAYQNEGWIEVLEIR